MNNNLDDFEFQKDVEIRPAAENKKPDKAKAKPIWLAAFIIMVIAFCALLFFTYSQMNQLRLKNKSFNTLKTEKEKIELQLKEKEEKLSEISKQLSATSDKLKNSSKGKEDILKNIDNLNKKLAQEKNISSRAKKEVNTLKKSLEKSKKDLKKQQKVNEENLKEIDSLRKVNTEISSDMKLLEKKHNGLMDEMDILLKERSDENSATVKIMSSMREKERKLSEFQSKNKKLNNQINTLNNEIESLKSVDYGELIPMSELVTPAKPLIKPDIIVEKKGLFSKVDGFVLLNVLINETGIVENANYLDKRISGDIDKSLLINRALTTIMKWKFSPALYNESVKVKVWQNVLVPVVTEK